MLKTHFLALPWFVHYIIVPFVFQTLTKDVKFPLREAIPFHTLHTSNTIFIDRSHALDSICHTVAFIKAIYVYRCSAIVIEWLYF
jgi:hypothetical protein